MWITYIFIYIYLFISYHLYKRIIPNAITTGRFPHYVKHSESAAKVDCFGDAESPRRIQSCTVPGVTNVRVHSPVNGDYAYTNFL